MFPKKRDCLSIGSLDVQQVTIKLDWTNEFEKPMPHNLEETDESYILSIDHTSNLISLSASEYSGLIRGLSTLAQLIKPHQTQGYYQINNLPIQI